MYEKVHLYVVHPLSQPDVFEDIPLLEYNVVGPNEVNLDDGPLGTKEKGPNKDCEVVMDKRPNEVDLDDGSEQVGEGINVETDEVGEQSEDSALDIQFGDSEEEMGLKDTFGEDVVHQSGQPELVNDAEQVTKVQKKGKDKEAGGSKPKRKRRRPFKKAEASGYDSNINCDDGDIVTEADQSTKINYRGLGDSDDYNSDEIQSGCDSDDEDVVDKEKFPTFKLIKDMKDYKWELGTYFQTKEEFQEGMKTYAIHSNRGLRFKKNDKERMRMVCVKGCKWWVYCAKIPNEETWQLRRMYDTHNCKRDYRVKLLNSDWLGKKLHTSVRENPTLKLTDIMAKTQHKWNLKINKTKAYKTKAYLTGL
jgi:hypothetical protein